jgi:protein SCO1/2
VRLAGALLGLVVVAAVGFAVFEPIQVLPRIRLAPGYALQDQRGQTFTSESVRGALTLYTFAPTGCGSDCDEVNATMSEVGDRVAADVELATVGFQRVTIALDDAPTTAELEEAARRSGADGDAWRWIGGDPDRIRTVVGTGFRRFYEVSGSERSVRFDPGFVLVDGSGVIRGEYRYQTIANDADKLVHHIDILATEIRRADGPAALAYEAAHLFLCYP